MWGLWWSEEAGMELDFLASSFLTGIVADEHYRGSQWRTGGSATAVIHTSALWRGMKMENCDSLPSSFSCIYARLPPTLGIFYFSSFPLSFLVPSLSLSHSLEIYEDAEELLHLCWVWGDKKLLTQQHDSPTVTTSCSTFTDQYRKLWHKKKTSICLFLKHKSCIPARLFIRRKWIL